MNPTPTLSPQVQEWRNKLHAAIMNLHFREAEFAGVSASYREGYSLGYRDARYAAAELALSAVVVQEPPNDEKLAQFDHHPDPAIDFCTEVEIIEAEIFDQRAGLPPQFDLAPRIKLAMQFKVGGDAAAVVAKQALRAIDASYGAGVLAASPQPVPGEALPAEQPKSEIAYPTSASGGDDLQTALPRWEPIETAPRDREVLFWIRPKTADESYTDTSGNPILSDGEPHIKQCRSKCWPSLWTATHWMEPLPLPLPPGESAGSAGSNEKAQASALPAPVEAVEVLRELVNSLKDYWGISLPGAYLCPTMTDEKCRRAKAAWDRARTLVAQPPQAVQEDERDAKRWRALVGCARIRPLGSAGLEVDSDDSDYGHLGLELWTKYPLEPKWLEQAAQEQERGVRWLERFADKAERVNGLKLAAISATTKENP